MQTCNSRNGTMEVSAVGQVEAAPDEAVVRLAVISEAPTANEAVAENAQLTQNVIDAVSAERNRGVTTSGPLVVPVLRYDEATRTSVITGYRAINRVNVTTDVDFAGRIFDVGIQAGANQSSGISFRVRDQAPYRDIALQSAIEKAYSDARIVAQSTNVQLDVPESIFVDAAPGPILFQAEGFRDSGGGATPVLPEQVTITAYVRIVFRTRI